MRWISPFPMIADLYGDGSQQAIVVIDCESGIACPSPSEQANLFVLPIHGTQRFYCTELNPKGSPARVLFLSVGRLIWGEHWPRPERRSPGAIDTPVRPGPRQ